MDEECNIEMENWFDPAFQESVDRELIPTGRKVGEFKNKVKSDTIEH